MGQRNIYTNAFIDITYNMFCVDKKRCNYMSHDNIVYCIHWNKHRSNFSHYNLSSLYIPKVYINCYVYFVKFQIVIFITSVIQYILSVQTRSVQVSKQFLSPEIIPFIDKQMTHFLKIKYNNKGFDFYQFV